MNTEEIEYENWYKRKDDIKGRFTSPKINTMEEKIKKISDEIEAILVANDLEIVAIHNFALVPKRKVSPAKVEEKVEEVK